MIVKYKSSKKYFYPKKIKLSKKEWKSMYLIVCNENDFNKLKKDKNWKKIKESKNVK